METERNEKTATEDNSDTAELVALLALRQSALIALCVGISPEYASRFVKEVMAECMPDGWSIGGKPAYCSTHMRNMAGAAGNPDVGDSRVSGNDSGNGE